MATHDHDYSTLGAHVAELPPSATFRVAPAVPARHRGVARRRGDVVVLSHLGLGFPGGYVGVDVFFVISGFLITRQLVNEFDRGTDLVPAFYARRAKRILPAATVVIIGTVLALWKWDSPLRLRPDALDGVFSAFSGINWRLAARARTTSTSARSRAPSSTTGRSPSRSSSTSSGRPDAGGRR